jgi:Histidine kinase-, DNA gyrase B-, and HSP90-like ATPase
MKEVPSIPNASRTIEALRNLGYDFNAAIADVVDNSITPSVASKNVSISLNIDSKDRIICRIQDDGAGMNEAQLEEAMRIGSDAKYENNDLGKFGMGMKAASLSQCDTITVISKKKGSYLAGYRWDINHVRNKGWILLKLDESEIRNLLTKNLLAPSAQGTIVFWDNLTWINNEYLSCPDKNLGQNLFFRIVENLKLYLGMIYHRFLDGSLPSNQDLTIWINNEKIKPWDPFCGGEPNTQRVSLSKNISEFTIPGTDVPVVIDAYLMPTKEGFSTEDAWKKAKGLLSWNDSQGYYIYRENRIIRFGGWHGTKAKDEHDKLARISVDIDSELDALFRITVNKTKIEFPEPLFLHLKNHVNSLVVRKAKEKYNKSSENGGFSNRFRRNPSVPRLSKSLVGESNISTRISPLDGGGIVEVKNPSGTWLSNKINEFLKYGSDKDYEITSDHLGPDEIWKIVCSQNEKFIVIINSDHPFYTKIYEAATNKATSNALDALFFPLAFAELYNKNNQNAHLFNTFKLICSKSLARIIEEGII